jgi:hypothetical protein
MCEYKTIQRRHLITHMENKHFNELKIQYICRLCGKQLSTKKVLRNHTRTVHSSRECVSCKLSFLRRSDLLAHNKSIHCSNLDSNSIPNCRIKSQYKPYQCNICFKAFKKEKLFLEHNMMHRMNSKNQNIKNLKNNKICIPCNLSFLRKCELLEHNRNTHNINTLDNNATRIINLLHKCNLCSRKFNTEQDVLKHVNAIHNKLSAFACTRCDKVFRSDMQLRMHKTTHAGMYMFD